MGFYTRVEDNIENAYEILIRKKSVNIVPCIGAPAYSHLVHRPYHALPEIISQLGFRLPYSYDKYGKAKLNQEVIEAADAMAMKIYQEQSVPENEIARVLGLEKMPEGGWISYLPGVCSHEYFRSTPDPNECSAVREGAEYPYISCFYGKRLKEKDYDIGAGEEVMLFSPRRLVWTYDVKKGVKVNIDRLKSEAV